MNKNPNKNGHPNPIFWQFGQFDWPGFNELNVLQHHYHTIFIHFLYFNWDILTTYSVITEYKLVSKCMFYLVVIEKNKHALYY